MEPGPRAANLESYNPLDAKFTMKKAIWKVQGKQSTSVTHSSLSNKKYTK